MENTDKYNNQKKAMDDFLNSNDEPSEKKIEKKRFIEERSGLIERIDRTLVTKDGKQLLREWY